MSHRPRSNAEFHQARQRQAWTHRLALIGVAALLVIAAMQATQAQKKGPTERGSISVTGAEVQSLGNKLQSFVRQLSESERGAMNLVLWRAAKAPLDDPAGTDITASFFDLGSPAVAGGGIYTVAPGVVGQPKTKLGGAGGRPAATGSVAR